VIKRILDEIRLSSDWEDLLRRDGSIITLELRNEMIRLMRPNMSSFYLEGKPDFLNYGDLLEKMKRESWGVVDVMTKQSMKQTFVNSFEKRMVGFFSQTCIVGEFRTRLDYS
jgi:uncharacterized protein YqgQ